MGKPTGFMEVARRDRSYAPAADRLKHYDEFAIPLTEPEARQQGARCMDCGIPYCHSGCPVDNIIPEWNDLVYQGDWHAALRILQSTNNFPEFTGRICPAPCEAACTLNITDEPVTIKTIEVSIIEKGWAEGWIVPRIAKHKTGKTVAVVGSGPAGMACAQQLARAGHSVVLYEKNARIGGLMRYGIPDFKLEKRVIDRRMSQMRAEGVEFRPNCNIGVTISIEEIQEKFDAVVLTGGAEHPRDMPVPGRELDGVHFAMDFLTQQNRRLAGEPIVDQKDILATGKHVVVIGGGDTGSDCVGTSNRQNAASVTQLEIMPKPPEKEDKALTWPDWPMKLRTSSSHDEGCERDWAVLTKNVRADANGRIEALELVRVSWDQSGGAMNMNEIPNSAFELKADLVLLAMGFMHPSKEGMLENLGVDLDGRGNVQANMEDYKTSVDGVFSAGDMRRGQSLVVWAIREGRQCARAVDQALMGSSVLAR
ncbi:MAG: glutamate synthase subunit beta [Alphaproteobacteria bacterium]|nr:glutamate synthase subunit beta [Alphaproteobacteria bacterium]